jgi:hypothetical protein
MEELKSLCRRLAQGGELTEDEQLEIFRVGQEVGIEYQHDTLDDYCENILEQVAIQLSPPSAPEWDRGCHFDDQAECPSWSDPLTLDDLDEKTAARVRCGKQVTCYDIQSLRRLVENDPRDPVTREPFSADFQREIMRRSLANGTGTKGPGDAAEEAGEIAQALRDLDRLYDPLERLLEYSGPAEGFYEKERYTREVEEMKKSFQDLLRSQDLDMASKRLIVFGTDDFEGDATSHQNRLMEIIMDQVIQ